MDISSDQSAGLQEIIDCLVRIQQTLISTGYSYRAGDEDAWPISAVQMHRNDTTLLIMPFPPGSQEAVAEGWNARRKETGEPAGLILVGTNQTDDPQVRALFDCAKGNVAYLDARRGEFRVHRRNAFLSKSPGAIHKKNLRKFLRPEPDPKSAHIDCRKQLAGDLAEIRQTHLFMARAQQVAGSDRMWLTWLLAGTCVVLFMAMVVQSGQITIPSLETLVAWGALFGPLVRHGQWWRLVTCAFVHVGVVHIMFNAMALFIFGAWVEKLQGRRRFVLFYFFSVVIASLASLWRNPFVVSAGASGGVFGLIGAMGAIIIRHRRDFPPGLRRAIRKWIFTILVYNAFFLLIPMIDYAAHIGGLLGGLVIALLLSRSPVRTTSTGLWSLLGTIVLLGATTIAGVKIIQSIPADAPLEPPAVVKAKTTKKQMELLDRLTEQVRSWNELVGEAEEISISVTDAPSRKAAADKIRTEILPVLGKDAEAELGAIEAESHKKAKPAVTAAGNLLSAHRQYCLAMIDALLRSQTTKAQKLVISEKRIESSLAFNRFTRAVAEARTDLFFIDE